jgi:hypothetical protein
MGGVSLIDIYRHLSTPIVITIVITTVNTLNIDTPLGTYGYISIPIDTSRPL